MPIMATRMHFSRMAAGMREGIPFGDRQRVHIGAKSDGALSRPSLDDPNDASLPEATMRWDAPTCESTIYEVGRALFLKGQLRMCVNVAPQI
jgi:hypothetical protein